MATCCEIALALPPEFLRITDVPRCCSGTFGASIHSIMFAFDPLSECTGTRFQTVTLGSTRQADFKKDCRSCQPWECLARSVMEQQAFSFSGVCQPHRVEMKKKRGADPPTRVLLPPPPPLNLTIMASRFCVAEEKTLFCRHAVFGCTRSQTQLFL